MPCRFLLMKLSICQCPPMSAGKYVQGEIKIITLNAILKDYWRLIKLKGGVWYYFRFLHLLPTVI
jgi:hypothetical protein